MSKYTTMLRWPIEQCLDSKDLDRVEDNWPETYTFAGLDDYPIFDESHRSILNNKIYRRYWYREIGFETWGQFRWHLRERMHEIMPYYNQLYESELLEITNPLYSKDMHYDEVWTRDEKIDVDQTGTDDRTIDNTSNTQTEATSHQVIDTDTSDKNIFQDTPMNNLDTGAVESMDYATNVTFDTGTTDQTSDTTQNTVTDVVAQEKYDQDTTATRDEIGDYDGTKSTREYGYDKSQAELLQEYRDTFLNIDQMILEELNCLFMGLW